MALNRTEFPVKARGAERVLCEVKFTGGGADEVDASTIVPSGFTVDWTATGIYDVVIPGQGTIPADNIWVCAQVESDAGRTAVLTSYTAATRTMRFTVYDLAVPGAVDLDTDEKLHVLVLVKDSSLGKAY